jgi:hypothetical protein
LWGSLNDRIAERGKIFQAGISFWEPDTQIPTKVKDKNIK